MSKEKVLFIYGLWVIAQMVKRHGGDWIGSNFKSLSLSLSLSLTLSLSLSLSPPFPKKKTRRRRRKKKREGYFIDQ
jgi:hypothetical protein